MRKIYWIGNVIYLPFSSNDWKRTKYVAGTINGDLFLNDIFTEEEIKKKHPDIQEVTDLHNLCNAWGRKMQ